MKLSPPKSYSNMFTCEYCGHESKYKYTLSKHQRSTKKCLEKQNLLAIPTTPTEASARISHLEELCSELAQTNTDLENEIIEIKDEYEKEIKKMSAEKISLEKRLFGLESELRGWKDCHTTSKVPSGVLSLQNQNASLVGTLETYSPESVSIAFNERITQNTVATIPDFVSMCAEILSYFVVCKDPTKNACLVKSASGIATPIKLITIFGEIEPDIAAMKKARRAYADAFDAESKTRRKIELRNCPFLDDNTIATLNTKFDKETADFEDEMLSAKKIIGDLFDGRVSSKRGRDILAKICSLLRSDIS